MKARITGMLNPGGLDPEGRAGANALHALGFESVEDVRQGKLIEVTLKAADETAARAEAEAMCQNLLANPVIETYRVESVT